MSLKRYLKSNINSWEELYSVLCTIPNDPNHKEAGLIFEEFCKYFFQISAEYKKVYHHKEIPYSIKKKLNLSQQEKGIDLLLEGHSNIFTGVQVKFRKNQNSKISWGKDKLSHLIAHRSLKDFIIFSNCQSVDKSTLNQKINIQTFLINELLSLKKQDFNNIRSLLNKKSLKKTKLLTPKPHQKVAIKNIISGFKSSKRGKLILPCGAGKTLTALWLYEKMRPKRTLVLVPSLSLLKQFKDTWRENRKIKSSYFCVCSDQDVENKNDSLNMKANEIGFSGLGVTTKPNKIKKWLKKDTQGLVVFSTYQSLKKIGTAIGKSKYKFDLAICDEAHKTAQASNSQFAYIHKNSNIFCKKRLYMTATPKVLSSSIQEEEKQYIYDMNKQNIFGNEFYIMSFKESIDQKILCDYKIRAVGVSDEETRQYIRERKFLEEGNMTTEDHANHIALKKAMKKYKAHHAISFHRTVKGAFDFSEFHKTMDKKCSSYHVSGTQNVTERKSKMNKFEKREKALITNARCLTEGVDIPAIDLVYFSDPKKSKVDIVQATGRALRKKAGKKFGYVIVPIFHSKSQDLNKEIEKSQYKDLVQIVRTLSDHDERLETEIQRILYGKGERKKGGESYYSIIREDENSIIQAISIPHNLKDKIYFESIRKGLKIWRPFKEARAFARKLNLNSETEWKKCMQKKVRKFLFKRKERLLIN